MATELRKPHVAEFSSEGEAKWLVFTGEPRAGQILRSKLTAFSPEAQEMKENPGPWEDLDLLTNPDISMDEESSSPKEHCGLWVLEWTEQQSR